MKFGIISDVHGGLGELNQALELLNSHAVDEIWCAGDLVDFGAESDAVAKQIVALKIPCVQGNHDRMARDNQPLRQRKIGDKPLSRTTLNLLYTLPLNLRFERENARVLLTHATPWGSDMYIYRESTPALFRRIAREAEVDVVILGHTHRPMWIEVDGCTIINAGSTSANYDLPYGTCGILILPERNFQVFNIETGDEIEVTKRVL